MCLFAGIAGMEENNISRMGFGGYALYDIIYTDVFPVQGVGIPLDDLVAQIAGYLKHSFIKIAIRHTDQVG
ncbi:hypothetical protein D3C85_1593420 [compost metagenome]